MSQLRYFCSTIKKDSNMHKILVFCPSVAGHRLEYLHHLYNGALCFNSKTYIFMVTTDFYTVKNKFLWTDAPNVGIVDIPSTIIQKFKGNILSSSYNKCKYLGQAVDKYKPDQVIVLDMIEYVPFLPFFVSSKANVSGIIYRIFLYEYNKEPLIKKVLDKFKYWWMNYFGVYDKVFILNDKSSSEKLNKMFNSSKFRYLPDPVVPIENLEEFNIRQQYSIPKETYVLLHPGGMLPYKGTIDILRGLCLLTEEARKDITVIFAGRVTESIKNEFDILCEEVKKKVQIIVEEGFLPYERLGALIKQSDWLLIPYKTKSQSSGIVGHAAYFEKPVIAVKGGLIGNIVSQYNLGILIEESTPECIYKAILDLNSRPVCKNSYCEANTIDNFVSKIICS
mgnify:CR=1 FL=1